MPTKTVDTPHRTDESRRRLERERRDLLDKVALAATTPPALTATTGIGETEHIASAIEHRVGTALDAHAAARLRAVDEALRRLDEGTYGECERCGSNIGAARLDAIPEARFCLTCQRRADAGVGTRRPR